MKLWQQVLRVQPQNTHALTNIGIVYAEQKRWPEAFAIFTQLVRLEPDNLDAHYGLGLVHMHQGEDAPSAVAWEHVLRLQPDNESARANLLLVRERMALAAQSAPAPAASTAESSPVSHEPEPHAASSSSAGTHSSSNSDGIHVNAVNHNVTPEPRAPSSGSALPFPDPAEQSAVIQNALANMAIGGESAAERARRVAGAKTAETAYAPQGRAAGARKPWLIPVGVLAIAGLAFAGYSMGTRVHQTNAPTVSETHASPQLIPFGTTPDLPRTNPPLASKPLQPIPATGPDTAAPSTTPESPRETALNKPLPAPTTQAPVVHKQAAAQPALYHRSGRVPRRIRRYYRRGHSTVKRRSSSGFNNNINKLLNQLP